MDTRPIKGLIIGDITGSVFEGLSMPEDWKNFSVVNKKLSRRGPDDDYKLSSFPLLELYGQKITDDTILTFAIAEWLLEGEEENPGKYLRKYCMKYPRAGYGPRFKRWALGYNFDKERVLDSYGNGCTMRLGPVVSFYEGKSARDMVDKIDDSCYPTHVHEKSFKYSKILAMAIRKALKGDSKEDIERFFKGTYVNEWGDTNSFRNRFRYIFSAVVEDTVPAAIQAFLESSDFENCIRLAVSLGGDTDTIAGMSGMIAGAYYGVPDKLWEKAYSFLDKDLKELFDKL